MEGEKAIAPSLSYSRASRFLAVYLSVSRTGRAEGKESRVNERVSKNATDGTASLGRWMLEARNQASRR